MARAARILLVPVAVWGAAGSLKPAAANAARAPVAAPPASANAARAPTPAATAAAARTTTSSAWRPAVGLAVVLQGRLDILRRGRVTVVATGTGFSALSWSADGRWLAFERTSGGTSSLWVVGVDGAGLRQVASGAVVSYGWATTGHRLAVATATATATGTGPPFSSTVLSVAPPSAVRVLDRIADGAAGPIVASATKAAFGDTVFGAQGFSGGSLLLEPTSGPPADVAATSGTVSYRPLGFSPDGATLLYAVDPENSASVAADGLQVRARRGTVDRSIGTALVDPGSWSWSPGGADLAITLGGSRAAWATDKHVWVCAVAAGGCRQLRSPAGTISFAPAYGAGGRFAYVTATGLGGPGGFGPGWPSGSSVDGWESTFRVWVSTGSSAPRELTALGAADDPQWVGGGPGLLVERSGALCWLRSVTARATCVTPRFLTLGFGDYGQFDWSGSFALAPR